MFFRLRQRLNSAGQSVWLPLVFIVGAAVLIRIPYLPGNGFLGDLGNFQVWISQIQQHGLFHFYDVVQQRPYPPVSIFLLASANGDIPSIKLPSVIAEVLIVVASYGWLRRDRLLRWLIPGLLAIHPGLIITTAWWGQNDALYTLAVLLVLVALNRDRPLIAWALFGLELATKQQSIVVAPLVIILSFRRYGWRRTVVGGLLAALIVGGLFLPFILASGLKTALSPYLALWGAASSLTHNAFNLWYAAARISGMGLDTPGRNLFLGALSYDQTGLLLLGVYTLVVSGVMWKQFDQRREFIWGSALYLGTFMLQTQIHERYLYPASILALLAIQQEGRMRPAAAGLLLTFSTNVIHQAVPTHWLGLPLVTSPAGTLPVALLNVLLLLEMLRIIIRPLHFEWGQWIRVGGRVFFRVLRISAAGLVLIIFFTSAGMTFGSSATAQWLNDHAADYSRMAVDTAARYTTLLAGDEAPGQTFDWLTVTDVTKKTSSAWIGEGVHYLVVDLTDDETAHQRQQTLGGEPTTLLYTYQSPLHVGPHLAVLWTFRPDTPLNITFDDSLVLIGYSLLHTEGGTRLLLHWYTQQTTTTRYTAFIHLIDSQTGSLIAQADSPLGGGSHPTDGWRPNELVFDSIPLPAVNSPYIVRIGLYQADRRAAIQDQQGNPMGDHIDIKP
jgi:Gpi18-like mannosyltransferase